MEINEEYIDNVKQLIEQKDADEVKKRLIDLHPADIAELCNDLDPEEARFIYRLLDNETAADGHQYHSTGGSRPVRAGRSVGFICACGCRKPCV